METNTESSADEAVTLRNPTETREEPEQTTKPNPTPETREHTPNQEATSTGNETAAHGATQTQDQHEEHSDSTLNESDLEPDPREPDPRETDEIRRNNHRKRRVRRPSSLWGKTVCLKYNKS